jgi:hypothetical protein
MRESKEWPRFLIPVTDAALSVVMLVTIAGAEEVATGAMAADKTSQFNILKQSKLIKMEYKNGKDQMKQDSVQ